MNSDILKQESIMDYTKNLLIFFLTCLFESDVSESILS